MIARGAIGASNDLLFLKPRWFRGPVLRLERTLASSGGNRGGHSNILDHCWLNCNKLIERPRFIMSNGTPQRAHGADLLDLI
jgi:hypothetical protein